MKINGSCLCGEVQYEAEAIDGKVGSCHCSRCRKLHGSAFATRTLIQGETLKINGTLKTYQGRAFCPNCGTNILNSREDINYYSVNRSSIDTPEYSDKPILNFCVESKAPWYEINDGIPGLEGFPTSVLTD